ncbi:MAG: methyltransferase domain-containing protein [Deltaproteobacteria bacterium]|nr:methyltransferase domain-containing protein [Deltaproteobacteria bacterium]
MDGNPHPKNKAWRGQKYSDTRFAIIKWLEKELPTVSGKIINIGAGGWPVPKSLIPPANIKVYKTFDKKYYGDTKNVVDIRGDVQKMPPEWTNKWDVILCLEVIECVPNPFKAFKEMYRVLRPGGTLLLSSPFNYRFFGQNTGLGKKKNRVYDYWRITQDGLEELCKDFKQVEIKGFGGTGPHDRFTYCVKATK